MALDEAAATQYDPSRGPDVRSDYDIPIEIIQDSSIAPDESARQVEDSSEQEKSSRVLVSADTVILLVWSKSHFDRGDEWRRSVEKGVWGAGASSKFLKDHSDDARLLHIILRVKDTEPYVIPDHMKPLLKALCKNLTHLHNNPKIFELCNSSD